MTYKPEIIGNSYDFRELDFEHDTRIEIYVDSYSEAIKIDSVIRIIVIQESHNTQGIVDFIGKNQYMYDYVFTWNDDILKTNEKARKFLCINTWIKDYDFPEKIFSVSAIVGGKNKVGLYGHQLRHDLWNRRNEINIPKRFYLSSHFKYEDVEYENELVLGDEKEPLFDTMFHIVIENASINNVFTEKLIDCFQTKTVPIYWGAPNIAEYFNVNGMLIIKTIDDVIHRANSITPEMYLKMLPYIEENYEMSMKYTSQKQLFEDKLNEVFS